MVNKESRFEMTEAFVEKRKKVRMDHCYSRTAKRGRLLQNGSGEKIIIEEVVPTPVKVIHLGKKPKPSFGLLGDTVLLKKPCALALKLDKNGDVFGGVKIVDFKAKSDENVKDDRSDKMNGKVTSRDGAKMSMVSDCGEFFGFFYGKIQ